LKKNLELCFLLDLFIGEGLKITSQEIRRISRISMDRTSRKQIADPETRDNREKTQIARAGQRAERLRWRR